MRCQTCRVTLDRPRGGRRCTECIAKFHEKARLRTDRRCYQCKGSLPETYKRELCPVCAHKVYVLKRLQLLRQGERPCKTCGEKMPVGRMENFCSSCIRKRRRKKGERPCSQCGKRVAPSGQSLCLPCNSFYHHWLSEYYKGSPEARMLKTKRTNRKWLEAR